MQTRYSMIGAIYSQINAKICAFARNIKVYQLVTLCTLITVFSYFPDINQYKSYSGLYHSIDKEINHPFDNASYTDSMAIPFNAHTEKRKFRLLVPLLAKILHTDSHHMMWLQFLLLPLFILVMYKVFNKITNDHITAVLLTLALPFFFVAESFLWVMPVFDSYGYLFLALLFMTNSSILRYFFLVAVCFCDERAMISSALVYISLQLYEQKELSFKKIISNNNLNIVFITGWLTHLVIRFILSNYLGLVVPLSSNDFHPILILISNYAKAPLGIFFAFEGFWILVIPALLSLLFSKKWFESSVIMGTLIFFFLINLMIYDITRSFGFCYTFIFISLLLLVRNEQISTLRNLAIFTITGCILIPTVLIYSPQDSPAIVSWLSPMIPKIFHFF